MSRCSCLAARTGERPKCSGKRAGAVLRRLMISSAGPENVPLRDMYCIPGQESVACRSGLRSHITNTEHFPNSYGEPPCRRTLRIPCPPGMSGAPLRSRHLVCSAQCHIRTFQAPNGGISSPHSGSSCEISARVLSCVQNPSQPHLTFP